MVKSNKYRVVWRVWEYGYTDQKELRQLTVSIFDEPEKAARFCIDGGFDGVEMFLIPKRG